MSATAFAELGPDLDSHDLVWGAFLPDLKERIDDMKGKKEEFTIAQARSVDWAGLPLLMNHDDKKYRVGITAAVRVRDAADTGASARAEAIFKLNKEPDTAARDELSELSCYQRALLMNSSHASLSLSHRYGTEYITDCGSFAASGSSAAHHTMPRDPGRVIRRFIDEISLCDHGLRENSNIYEYLPCRRSLQRSSDRMVREFVKTYGYTEPPASLEKPSPAWDSYIDTLSRECYDRRQRVLTDNGYNHLLGRANGTHAASLKQLSPTQRRTLKQVPWLFLPYVGETMNVRQPDILEALGRNVERDKE